MTMRYSRPNNFVGTSTPRGHAPGAFRMPEVLMHFIRITDDSTCEDIAEAALHLRNRQIAEPDPVVRAWLREDIDDLLDLWSEAVKVPH